MRPSPPTVTVRMVRTPERESAMATRGTVSGSHTYAAVGPYTAVVTATNSQGSVTAQTIVTVDKPTANPELVDFVVYLPVLSK